VLNIDPGTLNETSLAYPQVLVAAPFGATADLLSHWLHDDTITSYFLKAKARCSICGAVQPKWGPFFGPGLALLEVQKDMS